MKPAAVTARRGVPAWSRHVVTMCPYRRAAPLRSHCRDKSTLDTAVDRILEWQTDSWRRLHPHGPAAWACRFTSVWLRAKLIPWRFSGNNARQTWQSDLRTWFDIARRLYRSKAWDQLSFSPSSRPAAWDQLHVLPLRTLTLLENALKRRWFLSGSGGGFCPRHAVCDRRTHDLVQSNSNARSVTEIRRP